MIYQPHTVRYSCVWKVSVHVFQSAMLGVWDTVLYNLGLKLTDHNHHIKPTTKIVLFMCANNGIFEIYIYIYIYQNSRYNRDHESIISTSKMKRKESIISSAEISPIKITCNYSVFIPKIFVI